MIFFFFLIKECIFRYYNLFDIALFDTQSTKQLMQEKLK